MLTSGGVSVGEADFTRQLLHAFGDVAFWSLAMRPGRPLAFGRVWSGGRPGAGHPALFFGLPGNPVAVMVTFYQIVRDVLVAMSGAAPQPAPVVTATSTQSIRKRAGRTEYQRGIATRDAGGRWHVIPTRLAKLRRAQLDERSELLIVLAHEQGDVDAGDPVDIMLFDGLI